MRLLLPTQRSNMIMNGTGKGIAIAVCELSNKRLGQFNPLCLVQLFRQGHHQTGTGTAITTFINICSAPKLSRLSFSKIWHIAGSYKFDLFWGTFFIIFKMRSPGNVVKPVLGRGSIFYFPRSGFHGLFACVFQVAIEHNPTFKFTEPRRACGARGEVFLIRYNCVVIISN